MRRNVTILVSLAIVLAAVCSVVGKEKDASEQSGRSGKSADESRPAAEKSSRGKGKKLPGFTGEREAAAMTFVRTNHPELAELLDQLKLSDPAQYQRAIRDLFRSSERLAQIEERSPQRYPLELSLWKVDSRIQVLVAKMTMTPEPAIEDQLRQALAEQIQLRKQQLSDDRQRLEQKLAEMTADLDDLEQHQQQRIDRKMADLLEEASRTRSTASRRGGKKNSGEQSASSEKASGEKTSGEQKAAGKNSSNRTNNSQSQD